MIKTLYRYYRYFLGIIEFNVSIPLETDGSCPAGKVCAGPCPPGYYCFENQLTDLSDIRACPDGTDRSHFGASNPADCDTCPAGYHCVEGEGLPRPCPRGFYCPSWFEEERLIYQVPVFWQGPGGPPDKRYALNPAPDPIECPVYTYNDTGYAASIDDCNYCPPGYFCNEIGVGTLQGRECPAGYYCAGQGAPPMFCPAGRMSGVDTKAESMLDCPPCEAGKYCPEPSISKLNIAEELDICPPGYECPEGNRMPFLCKEGSFCPREGMTKGEICPAGYHCPEGTIDVYSDNTLRSVFIFLFGFNVAPGAVLVLSRPT